MNKLILFFVIILVSSFIVFLSIDSSKNLELLSNNDSSKYVLVEDIVWASPKGMDLTLDIYTTNSKKESYPVLIIFHGG